MATFDYISYGDPSQQKPPIGVPNNPALCLDAQNSTLFVSTHGGWVAVGVSSATFAKMFIENGTITNSSAENNALQISRIDNSPPVSGAGVINTYLAPTARIDLDTQSGLVTGAQTGLLVNLPSIKGKDHTAFNGAVTGGLGAQTVAVVDSSVFVQGDMATAGLNLGSSITEQVTIVSIPNSTHIVANFLNNHASGTFIGVVGKGDKIGIAVALSDQAGNLDSMIAENLNVTATSGSSLEVIGSEIDVTNNTGQAPGLFVGDTAPYIVGMSIAAAGGNPSSVGVAAGMAVGTATGAGFGSGFYVDSAINYGVVVNWGPAGKVATGVGVMGAQTTGIAVGSNQTTPANPHFAPIDPTTGILLTSKGTTGTVASNTLRFQELAASASNTWDLYAASVHFTISANGSPQLTLSQTGVLSVPTLIESQTLSPTSAATAGITGQLAWDGSNIYVCTAGGTAGAATWKKAALSAV